MKFWHKIFPLGHFIISLLFVICAFILIVLATLQLWHSLQLDRDLSLIQRLNEVLESIAFLTVAVAALELGQTLLEEEVQREAHMSAPTRVRRFLSRFMVVLVVSLSIETLVLVFRVGHDAPEQLPYAAAVGLVAGVLLAAWGVFIRFNCRAEELEPEAMAQAKREDEKLE
ncbi:hypothetical protein [Thiocystis violacea]|uniref:hypothetical protein n=1 Tax=Thiocystis violacea TaxID=13725 RepID=UPI0019039410|nr:hypothetical protein [Thiocystis violacea]MBK1717029.1 hypothetical protein [Thiocystis violacea]